MGYWSYYAFSLIQMSDMYEVWKYWPLKDGFCSMSKNFYRVAILWWVDQTSNFKLLADILFWEWFSKYCVVEFTAIFMCLLLSWYTQYSMKWNSNFVISIIVEPYTSIFQIWQTFAQIIDSLKTHVRNFCFEKGAT